MKQFYGVGILGSFVLASLAGCSGAAQEASNNTAPLAQNVTLSAAEHPAHVGAVLQGSYQYADPDGDGENGTVKAWLRDGQLIEGANQDNYIVTALDSGKNLQYRVTPAAVTGKSPGEAADSSAITIENSAPTATLSPPRVGTASTLTAGVGSDLTIDIIYNDLDDDEAAAAEIRWLRRAASATTIDENAIPNATGSTYTVTSDDLNSFLVAEVTPLAKQGIARGATVRSQPVFVANSVPVAQSVKLTASTNPVNVGSDLTASYTYFDADNDPEEVGGSAVQWWRNGNVIPGVSTLKYTLTLSDADARIHVTLTPRASTGTLLGETVMTDPLIVVNSAPQASNVVVGGASVGGAVVGTALSGSYSYSDRDLNPQGASLTRWYRGTSVIPVATGLNYTVIAADSGNDLVFEITPVATQGTLLGIAVRSASIPVKNSAPVARNVTLALPSGVAPPPKVGDALVASYTYFDADGDAQGASAIRWLSNGAPTIVAQGLSYTLLAGDSGKTITFEVTPKATTGELSGSATLSNGIVTGNSAPTATAVIITPNTAQVKTLLTASFSYTDLDNDPQGASVYEWSNGAAVIGTGASYAVAAADAHKTLSVKVTPLASSGASPGVAATSTGLVIDNSPPSIANVAISGSVGGRAYTGVVLSATYSFQDPDGDGEGSSTYQWLYDGTTPIPIGGATLRTYTVTGSDIGKALTVQVTPKDNFAPPLTGTPVTSPAITPVNLAPVASNVVLLGKAVNQVGDVLSVSYTRTDFENDQEPATGSSIQWLRNNIAIVGATSAVYTLTLADTGKMISVQVTPLSQTGTSPGLPVVSNAVVPNSAPVAQNVTLSANAAPAVAGTTLIASYNYFDAEGDLEGASTMRWLRNGTAITGASGKSYIATSTDAGQSIVFEVTPNAASGVLNGSATLSNGVAIIKTYTIGGTVSNLSGSGLSLSLSNGNNTSTETLAISTSTFTFATPVASGSTYTLTITTNPTGQDCHFANNTNSTTGSVSNSAVNEALSCYARKFNDTGITADQCYQAGSDVLVPCSSAGATTLNPAQDGMVGRDANLASNDNTDGKLGFNFTSVAGGCVQDNVTGLMWEVKTADGGLRDWSKTYTNYSAAYNPSGLYGTATDASGFVTAVNATNLCGFGDWRLPSADELYSIVDYSVASPGPTIDAAPNTLGGAFWSDSPVVGDPTSDWLVSLGQIYSGLRYSSGVYVRLVRAGQPPAVSRYAVSADGQEVTDSRTNLIWRRCSESMVFSGGTCTGTAGLFTHEAALTLARDQASSTSIAWRLPNVKELASIADKSLSNPAIDSTAFPATPAGYFWSASPYVSDSSSAWFVYFNVGYVGHGYTRNVSNYVRLVRAGQ